MRKAVLILMSLLLLTGAVVAGCAQPAPPEGALTDEEVPPEEAAEPEPQPAEEEGDMVLSLSSSAFEAGGGIPAKYTCRGENISPPLSWSQAPAGTSSFALIMDDPDTPRGVFTHWVLFNLPPDSRELPKSVPTEGELASGALQGKNDVPHQIGYFGPCPPSGVHHYRFTLYALDKTLDLAAGASKEQVLAAMQGHILAQDELVGTYQR